MKKMNRNIDDICNATTFNRQDYHPVSPEIVMTSSFRFADFADYVQASQNEFDAFVYTRGTNPTTALLEEKLAELESGEKAKVFASGMGAISATLFSFLNEGDHVLFVNTVYSTTLSYIKFMKRYGIGWTVVNTTSIDEITAALRENTRILYFESPSTQKFEMVDLREIATLAKEHRILTVIDNTWSTPIFQNPLQYGIDLVIHSCSKYIGGHSDIVCGTVIGSRELIRQIEQRGYVFLGSTCSPMNAYLALRGLRTLPVRMRTLQKNVCQVLDYLKRDPRIERIFHPYCGDDYQRHLAKSYLRGYGSLFSFQLKDKNLQKYEHFINSITEFVLGVSWGGYESMILPAFKGTNQASLAERGLDVTHTRMYVGLNDPQTLMMALQKTLDQVYGPIA
jgi:cystathionine beta-lyase/cystathionine gamma-synthase